MRSTIFILSFLFCIQFQSMSNDAPLIKDDMETKIGHATTLIVDANCPYLIKDLDVGVNFEENRRCRETYSPCGWFCYITEEWLINQLQAAGC